MPGEVGRSHWNSEKAGSRSSREAVATCQLSMDCAMGPLSA